MTRESKDFLKHVGQLLAIVIGVITLTAMVKAGTETWLVPRRHFEVYVYQRDSALAVWLTRDTVFKADINQQLRELKLMQRSRR